MNKNFLFLVTIFVALVTSCDDDFNTIGSDLVGDQHFETRVEYPSIRAYSLPTDEIQTNNLPINPFGIYNNVNFGTTKANFVTQVSLPSNLTSFGTEIQIEEVILYVPYFSNIKSTDKDGAKTYTLDSIYSNSTTNEVSKMKLRVYENGFYLNSNSGSDLSETAKYYSDLDAKINAIKRGNDGSGNSIPNGYPLNDSPNVNENDQFFFNKEEIVIYKRKFNTTTGIYEYVNKEDVVLVNQNDVTARVVEERKAPGMYLKLNKEFFKKRILDANPSNLINNNAFQSYFKGLYFQVEQISGQEGVMAMINFSNSKFEIKYSSKDLTTKPLTSKTLVLSLVNKSDDIVVNTCVSLQNVANNGTNNNYLSVLNNPNNSYTSGVNFGKNDRLAVKGGNGSLVYIDLFGNTDIISEIDGEISNVSNGVPDEIDNLRAKGYLINDAYLEFFVDQSMLSIDNQEQKNNEPLRLYLYDATNNKPILDYNLDTSFGSNVKKNKLLHGGIVERDATTGKSNKYKIRITNYINNIINSDNVNLKKNFKLGLSVTENIGLSSNINLKSNIVYGTGLSDKINLIPASSVLSQQGTILHGTESTETYTNALGEIKPKKLRLTIHYTKPN